LATGSFTDLLELALYRSEKIAGLLPLASALAALGPDSATRERQSPRRKMGCRSRGGTCQTITRLPSPVSMLHGGRTMSPPGSPSGQFSAIALSILAHTLSPRRRRGFSSVAR
jgi:hypothetical protein